MKFNKHVLALAAALSSGAAFAASIPASGLSASAQVNGVPGSAYVETGYTNNYANEYGSTGYGYASSFANQHGAYAASSRADGRLYDASAQAGLRYEVTNTTGISQTYSLNFYLYGGYLQTRFYDWQVELTGNDALLASYFASVNLTVGGHTDTLWSSGATLSRTANGIELTKTGADLNEWDDEAGSGDYYWSGRDVALNDFVTLAAGESFTLELLLGDRAFSDVGTYVYDGNGGYGYGYGGYGCGYGYAPSRAPMDESSQTQCIKGWAQAFYGDPADFGADGVPPGNGLSLIGRPTANAVPEPGAFGLAGLALLGLGLTRRRRTG